MCKLTDEVLHHPSLDPSRKAPVVSTTIIQDGEQQQTEVVMTTISFDSFTTYRRDIELGLMIISIIYGIAYTIPVPMASKYCESAAEDALCFRPDLFAFQVTCASAMVYMGSLGARNWYFKSSTIAKSTPEERMFGYWPDANHQNVAILCYQIWDFVASCTIPEHRDPIFLIHHVLAGLTAYWSLQHQCMTYYSVYFGGCSEISSIFLLWINVDQMFPDYNTTNKLSTMASICKVCFVLTFFVYRVYGWIRISLFGVWKDSIHVLQNSSADGKSFYIQSMLALNVSFGLLQLYWFMDIIQKASQAIQG